VWLVYSAALLKAGDVMNARRWAEKAAEASARYDDAGLIRSSARSRRCLRPC